MQQTYKKWKLMGKKRKETRIPNYNYPAADDGGWHMFGENFVCFDCCRACRRGFKQMNWDSPVCPECGKEMTRMGCKIEIPKRSDKKAWKLLKKTYNF